VLSDYSGRTKVAHDRTGFIGFRVGKLPGDRGNNNLVKSACVGLCRCRDTYGE
jgi:hypothetical protein